MKTNSKSAQRGKTTNGKDLPAKWQVEQWQRILKDANGPKNILWKKIIANTDVETRAMLEAYRAYESAYREICTDEYIRFLNDVTQKLGAQSGYWNHDKVWKVVKAIEDALIA